MDVKANANTTPKMKMKAILALLDCKFPLFWKSAAVAATMARQTAIPIHDPVSIFLRPTISWNRAPDEAATHPVKA